MARYITKNQNSSGFSIQPPALSSKNSAQILKYRAHLIKLLNPANFDKYKCKNTLYKSKILYLSKSPRPEVVNKRQWKFPLKTRPRRKVIYIKKGNKKKFAAKSKRKNKRKRWNWKRSPKYILSNLFRKYFLWKKFKRPNLIKRYIAKQKKWPKKFWFFRPKYKKIKKSEILTAQTTSKLLRRLRNLSFFYKFKNYFTNKPHWRRKASKQIKYKTQKYLVLSWCKHRIKYNLKLLPSYFLILLQRWKLSTKYKRSKKFVRKTIQNGAYLKEIRQRLRRNNYLFFGYIRKKTYKLFLLRKIFLYSQRIKSGLTKYNWSINYFENLGKILITPRTTRHRLYTQQVLPNVMTFKQIYKEQYNISQIEQIKYILENKYREGSEKSPNKFMNGPRIQRLKYPWLPQMISKKRGYCLQYFNFYRSLRTPWARKSNKIYRTFMSITKHRHERVKLKRGSHGGNRAIHFKLNLLKVILPFYGQLSSTQLKKIWHKYRYIKSHYQGRYEQFYNKLNTTLCLLIQQLGWAPNTYWAQNSIKNGWISLSKLNGTNKLKKYSNQQRFPLLNNLQTDVKQCQQMNSKKNPFHQLQHNEIVQIHPDMKIFCKEFFLRRLNWQRRRIPDFMEIDSNGVSAAVVNLALNASANTKDRNKKNFLRYIIN